MSHEGCGAAEDGCLPSEHLCGIRNEDLSSFGSERDHFEAIVGHYIEHHRKRAARELEYFSRVLRSPEEAVSHAALARLPSGKRHSHQYRIPRVALEESRRRLLDNLPELLQATCFDDLFTRIDAMISPIPGIGELTVYDTTLRIGAHLGQTPMRVYLHAGTRAGARALGFDHRRHTIEMDELPVPMRILSAREAEDLLCIYKDELGLHNYRSFQGGESNDKS